MPILNLIVHGERTMNYLGQQIEILETERGWIGIWQHHLAGRIEIKFFQNSQDALELLMQLIRQDLAVVSLLRLIDEWHDRTLLNEWEHGLVADSLVQSVLAVLSSK